MATAAPTEPRECVACGGRRSVPRFRGLVACDGCGMVYFPRRVGPGEAALLYDEGYFRGAEYFDYLADRPTHAANFRARVRALSRWLPAGKRLYEVGCSYGLFLDQARGLWRVAGCDVSAEPCRYARDCLGLDVVCGDFRAAPVAPGSLDAVCLWDTIEHLDDPAGHLARAAVVLPEGGLLALTTGDIGSLLARVQGPRWRQIHPPTHLWYFSSATIRRALARFGFEVVWSGHVGVSRSLAQVVYSLTSLGRPHPSPVHAALMRTPLKNLRVWSNTFDLLMVVARRRAA